MRIKARMLSSKCASRASRYRGTRLAANGRKRVEMKKNSTSCVLLTGLIASAYAAGSPRTSTRRVETMLAMAELMKNGGKSPDSPSWNSIRVGTKKIVGGELAACGSVFRPSSHIQMTGKKKTNTTSQPTTDHKTFERRGVSTVLIAWPPPERSRTAFAGRRLRRGS